MISKQKLMDLSFLEARGKLLEVAAFLDRLDRCEGEEDFRIKSLRQAIPLLFQEGPGRVRAILEILSDYSSEPIACSPGKAACGAPMSEFRGKD